jgi:hypothetical protein
MQSFFEVPVGFLVSLGKEKYDTIVVSFHNNYFAYKLNRLLSLCQEKKYLDFSRLFSQPIENKYETLSYKHIPSNQTERGLRLVGVVAPTPRRAVPQIFNLDGFVKSLKTSFGVIPAKAGIQCFQYFWMPAFAGMTEFWTFYKFVNLQSSIFNSGLPGLGMDAKINAT